MEILDSIIDLMENLQAEIEAYNEKPTKAVSLRIRKLTQQLGNQGKFARAELIAADKEGY